MTAAHLGPHVEAFDTIPGDKLIEEAKSRIGCRKEAIDLKEEHIVSNREMVGVYNTCPAADMSKGDISGENIANT
jgi:hypothetical protein